jgi:esterase/lipase
MFGRLRTADKQLVLVENSGHIMTRDLERHRVVELATAFIRRVTGWPASPSTRGARR